MITTRNLAILLLALPMTTLVWCQQSATDRTISRYQARVASAPGDPSNYDGLGAAYLQKGRETSDLTYYELAEKALAKSLELTSPMDMAAAAPLTHLAAAYMAEHRFSDAA